jgi:hypothetical protein
MFSYPSIGSPSHPAEVAFDNNLELTNHINDLASSKHGDVEIKEIIARLCHNMVQFSDYCRELTYNEITKINAWSTFLCPIEALMKLSHPHINFITARMVLYLGGQIPQGLDEKTYSSVNEELGTEALCRFCIELDDALLEPLQSMWKASKNSEDFKWAFVDDRIHLEPGDLVMDDDDLKIAQALSPSERARLSKEDGTKFYYVTPSDVKAEPTLFDDLIPRWDCGQEDTDGFLWTSEGSDGPIRSEIPYTIRGEDGDEFDKRIPLFRRSRQFCLDARQIAEGKLGKQVRILLDGILKHHRVPREIQCHILKYLHREPFPYIQKLDLASAYAPFPKKRGRCADCHKSTRRSPMRRTCPNDSIYIWNLPLRCLHVFHIDEFLGWGLCAHGAECMGHHDSHDREWIVGRGPELALFIEKEASKLNDEFISLDQAGLGPAQKIRLDTEEEDMVRQERLVLCEGIYRDSVDDWQMIGGLGGLIDCMLHGRVLIGAWARGRHNDEKGIAEKPAQWALARDLGDQRRAEKAIKDLHAWPGRCEWC